MLIDHLLYTVFGKFLFREIEEEQKLAVSSIAGFIELHGEVVLVRLRLNHSLFSKRYSVKSNQYVLTLESDGGNTKNFIITEQGSASVRFDHAYVVLNKSGLTIAVVDEIACTIGNQMMPLDDAVNALNASK
ncbi:MAG: hypothetical protein BWY47_00666 [Bacteroidetes bacterium ADurb.Bin302]|nr:MAG: hypothetical protein BWY47_00666 [Bacteroidetes bacterium ADurb.Bin302]